ncbi:Hcp transcriptional regulator HcpR [Lachnospiraceae bacterium KM106-2]|nr:Hcp transcriptional regulator HcpR [Lachnospiraceae bacterium KM106-2]
MNNINEIIATCPLFGSIDPTDYDHMLRCLGASVKEFNDNDYVFLSDMIIEQVGIVLEGSVEIIKESLSGHRHIIAVLGPGNLFGEGIVCTKDRRSAVSVRTREHVKILFIPYLKIMTTCAHGCSFHHQIIYNMMHILGEKNNHLTHKMEILTLKGMREKLATYLISEQRRQNKKLFYITLNRNELAEYLNVSRPSMSRELARMKEEGIIDYHKNCFSITNMEQLIDYLD